MKEDFIKLLGKYPSDEVYINHVWQDLHDNYSSAARHYHTLQHLQYMFDIISPYENKLGNKDAVLFAVWFHDVVYDSNRNDNEEKSAEFAKNVLEKIKVPNAIINKVTELILLTKNHSVSPESDFDSKILLDADLAVLGGTLESYKKYMEGVRKEYSQYPDTIYNPGRKKVLEHFLEHKQIYVTDEIRSKLEAKARENLMFELKQL